MPSAAQKQPLRRLFRKRRRDLPSDLQLEHAQAIVRHLTASPIIQRLDHYAAYLSADGELDTMPTLVRLAELGKTLLLPVINFETQPQRMDFVPYQPGDELTTNQYGLAEPKRKASSATPTPELVLSPLVAFDERGIRLGMGGGYYDRFAQAQPNTLVIGLAHECQRSFEYLPKDAWDKPLDAVITERGWQCFSARANWLLPHP